MQWSSVDHTEAWVSKPCAKGGVAKSQSLHSKLHRALDFQEEMCPGVTEDRDNTTTGAQVTYF